VRTPRLLVLALAIGLVPQAAFAAGDDGEAESAEDPHRSAAEALFEEGLGFARQGSWGRAVNAYQRSLNLYFSPRTLYSLGVAQSKNGEEVAALATMDQFLALPQDPELEAFREAAVAERKRLHSRIATVTLDVPSGAHVLVDDQPVARPSSEPAWVVRLPPGVHLVEMRSEAGTTTQQVDLRPGERRSLRLRNLEASPTDDPSSARVLAGWSLLGIGAGFGLASLGTGIASLQMADGAIDGTSTATEARRLAVATDVLVVVGLAAAATGGGLLIAEEVSEDTTVGLGLGGLTVTF